MYINAKESISLAPLKQNVIEPTCIFVQSACTLHKIHFKQFVALYILHFEFYTKCILREGESDGEISENVRFLWFNLKNNEKIA